MSGLLSERVVAPGSGAAASSPIFLLTHADARAAFAFDACGGRRLLSDHALPGFVPIARDAMPVAPVEPRHDRDEPATIGAPTTARGWLRDAERNVTCRRVGAVVTFAVASHGGVAVSRDGRRVVLDAVAAHDDALRLEWLLGIGLVHALARDGTFSLHGCAGLHRDALHVFVGPSGAGKSTLARAMTRRAGWSRAVDDVLPIGVGERPHGLPRFPQLKLDPSRWYPADAPSAPPIATITVLRPRGGAPSMPRALPPVDARRAMIANTAGARLFDAPLLAAHLDAMTALAQRVAVHELAVRDDPGAPDRAADEALAACEASA